VTAWSVLLAFDLDGTLVGDTGDAPHIYHALCQRPSGVRLAYVTGRTHVSARRLLAEAKLPQPDVLATGLGTEIRWGPEGKLDRAWHRYVSQGYTTRRVRRALAACTALVPQPAEANHRLKSSYWIVSPPVDATADLARRVLRREGLRVHLVASSGRDLDVVPVRAGKGQALRWIARRLGVTRPHILACGDSCNDLDMLRIAAMPVAVGNAEPMLVRQLPSHAYLARASEAEGAWEGLEHWLGSRLWLPRRPAPDTRTAADG
jgi:sucrose-6F-phosphate phosphohydrolase